MSSWHTFLVVREESTGHRTVRIGKSRNPSKRIAALQSASRAPLQILLILPGDCEEELHARFAPERERGDWFPFPAELQAFIERYTGKALRTPFVEWLEAQERRDDDVGRFAFYYRHDYLAPRTNKLYRLLNHYTTLPLRRLAKNAHAEWRQS